MKLAPVLLAFVCWLGAASCSDESAVASNGGGSTALGGSSGADAGGTGGTSGSGGSAGAGDAAGSAGAAGSDAATPDLCVAPAGNILAHGDFEEGMSGNAPSGWEVRDPAAPGNCAGSGAAAEHVFLAPPAPGCSGNALAVDARGQWDCYAIQRVTDYDSIQGGATYRVSATVRSTGNAVNPAAWFVMGAQWLDGSDVFFGDVKNEKTTSAADNDYDWKLLSFDVVAPQNAKRMLIWLSAHYPGRVDFDDVSVVKL
ncbi:MAG: hypothetical protein H6717_04930 [Polyangiaceae bacterium]|nr:hypothetical protein [Polyangiaceae bacterium]